MYDIDPEMWENFLSKTQSLNNIKLKLRYNMCWMDNTISAITKRQIFNFDNTWKVRSWTFEENG